MQPAVFWQQGWVNIEHAAMEAIDQSWGQDTHKSSKDNQTWLVLLYEIPQGLIVAVTVGELFVA
jgi:hypothetical protein